jgi:hypothetical protein
MNSQQLQRPALTTRQTRVRRWQWLGLGLSGIVAALAIAFYATSGDDSSAHRTSPSVVQSAAIDPAVPGMTGYLRAHANVDRAMAADPAQQSVLDYLRVHSAIQSNSAAVVAVDPPQQSVLNYLHMHAAVETQPLDPAQQGVLDYLRAHSR